MVLEELHKIGIGAFSINVRLAHAQKVQVRAVENKEFHPIASHIFRTVSVTVPVFSMAASAQARYRGSRSA